jgi:hypothetical protein
MSTWGSEPQPNQPTGEPGDFAPAPPTPGAFQPNPGYAPPAAPESYGYPQQPYGQPQYPTAPPQDPYAAQPAPYGAPQPYPTYQQLGVPAKKNPLLGRISFALVLACAVVATISVGPIATVHAQLIVSSGTTQIDSNIFSESLMSSASGSVSAWTLASMVGFVSTIIGLVAGITGRGRAWGITAFILGLLAPAIWFVYWIILVFPAATLVAS